MQCEHIKADGERCKVTWGVSESSGRCFCHCPERAEERAESRRKGQAQSAHVRRRSVFRTVPPDRAPPRPETIEDAAAWSSWATLAVATGQLDARTAREIAGLLRVLVSAVEKGALTAQVAELKRQVAALRKGKAA